MGQPALVSMMQRPDLDNSHNNNKNNFNSNINKTNKSDNKNSLKNSGKCKSFTEDKSPKQTLNNIEKIDNATASNDDWKKVNIIEGVYKINI